MKKYKVLFEESYKIIIEAETKEEAFCKFTEGEYDNAEYIEITGYDIEEEA